MPTFVVEHAQRKNDYTDKFGPKVSYTVKLQGQDVPVELSQKPETAAPVQGQSLDGTIEQGTYGPRFKKTFTQGGLSAGTSGSKDSDAYRSPEQIMRSYAQGQALQYWKLKHEGDPTYVISTWGEFQAVVELFYQDAKGAS